MILRQLGEHQMILPLPGDAEISPRDAFADEAGLFSESDAGNIAGDHIRLHAVQGMFGDPRHGGNAGFAGWDLLGFPGVKVTFTAEDQALDVDVERIR